MKAERIAVPAPGLAARAADAIGTFWAGFTAPSRFALLLTLAVFSLTVLAGLIFVTPATLAGPLGDYLPRNTSDGDGFATIEALRLAQPEAGFGAQPRLYVIGNSVTAHSFASDLKIERDLQDTTRQDWDVHFLTTPYQGPLDEAALADFATMRRPGVVVLSLGFERFGAPRETYFYMYRLGRLGFRSNWQDAQLRLLGGVPRRRTGIYAIDNRKFLIRNAGTAALRRAAGRPAERRIDIYAMTDLLQMPTYHAEVVSMLHASDKPDPLAVNLMSDLTKRLKERGNTVVFFEAPISPSLLKDPADQRVFDKYLTKSRSLVADMKGYYCRPPASLQPPASAFSDYLHLTDATWQGRLRGVLAQCVADAVRGEARS